MNEVKGRFFSLLIDKSRDCSIKEQMAVVLIYVDDGGEVIERFIGIVHVIDTCASSLKSVIDNFFAKHGTTMSRVRGQGYDGASNMRGELNGLKQKILHEDKYAFYIHYFPHQLQLIVVVTSSEYAYLHVKGKMLSGKKQYDDFVKRIEMGEICTGKGKNQETSLARDGDTHWGSHLKTIHRLLDMWKPVREVLIALSREGPDGKTRGNALSLAEKVESFEFVFVSHLMLNLLRMTN
ncbi:zinc finger MYM-type protein 1-like [Helianthus annuus]|uniref:zinc finger MYM-type protein 1-like n=1 Tax=Helianthus annuus TaxID=4232 RepID=UPI000B8F162C|nr:zinc finger MYM-type protein 1-like [Helianthus annuus]